MIKKQVLFGVVGAALMVVGASVVAAPSLLFSRLGFEVVAGDQDQYGLQVSNVSIAFQGTNFAGANSSAVPTDFSLPINTRIQNSNVIDILTKAVNGSVQGLNGSLIVSYTAKMIKPGFTGNVVNVDSEINFSNGQATSAAPKVTNGNTSCEAEVVSSNNQQYLMFFCFPAGTH